MKRSKRLGDDWKPKWRERFEKENKHKLKKMREKKFKYPPDLTNKQRFEIRRQARIDAEEIVREAGL